MKIVYMSASMVPSRTANSIHTMKMCHAFAHNGHEVVLYVRASNISIGSDDVFSYYGVENNFKIKYLKFRNIPYYGHLHGLFMALDAAINKTDIVIARHPAGSFFSALFGLSTVFEIHGPIKESGKLTRLFFKIMRKLPSFKRLILITNTLKEHYLDKYNDLSPQKIVVLPDAADMLDLSKVRPRGIRTQSKLNIGYTGHLYKGKGMEIISQLIVKCPEWHFHIVGGRDTEIKFWRAQLEGHENVSFYGAVPHSSIASFLLDFDIVLLPNQLEVSGNAGKDIGNWTSPLKLFEYMSAKRCIIASDLPVLREILENGTNALLCDPNDADDWMNVIKSLSNNKELKHKITRNAYADFVERYTWAKRADKILESLM